MLLNITLNAKAIKLAQAIINRRNNDDLVWELESVIKDSFDYLKSRGLFVVRALNYLQTTNLIMSQ